MILGPSGTQPALISISNGIGDATKPESYYLSVNSSGVIIEAPTERGAFYGLMTLLQLIGTSSSGQPVPMACTINDWPDLPWRAMDLDGDQTPGWLASYKGNTAINATSANAGVMPSYAITPIIDDNIVNQIHSFGTWTRTGEGLAKKDVLTLKSGS